MIKEVIILAGGLGTRLRSVISDIPKCMAPVNGRPFLVYIIHYLQKQGVEKFILSVGYKHEAIINYFNEQFPGLNVQFSIEKEPLGTGGAIKHAAALTSEKDVLIANGDTFFSLNVEKLSLFHNENNANCTIAIKPMQNFDRYGVVELNNNGSVRSFKEKQFYRKGYINGGVYALNVKDFAKEQLPEIFSFEKDYLEKDLVKRRIFGLVQDEYFIDIGIPEDYIRAQQELNLHITM
jgi:D-glycero-alpha-D-manno-heptose 1-phosphate guanylyltransferase